MFPVLLKSRVKGHVRTLKSGKRIFVSEYTDSRTKNGDEHGHGTGRGPALSGTAGRGGAGRREQRPGLITVGAKNIPQPGHHVGADSYGAGLGDDQQLGVNLALTRFADGGRAFLLADGTGVGKTRELLAIADQWANKSGKPSLIVTQNNQIIEGSFREDGNALGIRSNTRSSNNKIKIITYSALRSGIYSNGKWGVVLFDEAHNLKNVDSAKAVSAKALNTDHVVYATATPMDRPTAASYFLAEITDLSEDKIQKELGYRIETSKNADGELKRHAVLREGMSWDKVMLNIVDLRNMAIENGAMIRREFPFYGEITDEEIELSPAVMVEQTMIEESYKQAKQESQNSSDETAARNVGQQRINELSRWLEPHKADHVWAAMQQDLKSGKQVVIVADYVKPSNIKGLDETRESFIGLYAKRLEAAGIPFAKVYGAGSKGEEVARFQSGKAQVVLMTPQSGGTGVNLDDTGGDRPRAMHVVTANYSGDLFEQIIGRVSRRKTASASTIKFYYAKGAVSDDRRKEIVARKIGALRAIQKGEDVDVSRGVSLEEDGQAPSIPKEQKARKERGKVESGKGDKVVNSVQMERFNDRSTFIRFDANSHAIQTAIRTMGLPSAKPTRTAQGKGWIVKNQHVAELKNHLHRLTKSRRVGWPILKRKRCADVD